MGYSCSPRIWTKLLKPVFAYLRSLGQVSGYFTDDSCLFGETYQSCLFSLQYTVHLMDNFGLGLNQKKSVLVPCKKIVFLGLLKCLCHTETYMWERDLDEPFLSSIRLTSQRLVQEF